MSETSEQAKKITCPECERVWPVIAEQGVVTKLIDKCYQCFIEEVVRIRDELSENADYIVKNCDQCGGLDPARRTCIMCGGRGWDTEDKKND